MNWFRAPLKAFKWLVYFGNTAVSCLGIPWLKRKLFKATWADVWVNERGWAIASNRLFGVEVECHNPYEVSLGEQYILAANHRSWFDQLVVAEVFPQPIHFLAKKGYFEIPIFGYALSHFIEGIPVENQKLLPQVFSTLIKYLKAGDTSLFFIEGTRGTGKTLLPFNPGAFKLSAKLGVPILPLYLFGTEQILSKHKSLLTVEGGKVVVFVDKPRMFSKENLEEEMAAFEQEYRLRHDAWYDQFEREGKIRPHPPAPSPVGEGET